MNTDFEYYIIQPIITERTVLLMNDGRIDEWGSNCIFINEPVADDCRLHLRFLMPHDNPDMTVDFFDLETFAVFSERVCNALRQIMPIKNLQLIEATIKEYEEEYENFRVAHIHGIREIRSFDEKLSKYEEIDEDGGWWGIEKIVLDRERLSQIPLEDRLIFLATEFTSLKLYHKSVVDAIMSVNPRGMKVTKVEDWIL